MNKTSKSRKLETGNQALSFFWKVLTYREGLLIKLFNFQKVCLEVEKVQCIIYLIIFSLEDAFNVFESLLGLVLDFSIWFSYELIWLFMCSFDLVRSSVLQRILKHLSLKTSTLCHILKFVSRLLLTPEYLFWTRITSKMSLHVVQGSNIYK